MIRRALILLILLTGCTGVLPKNDVVTPGSNYTIFEHPFTDAAAEDVRKQAIKLCAQKKLIAIKTQSVCSLTKCSTTYQCAETADAAVTGQ